MPKQSKPSFKTVLLNKIQALTSTQFIIYSCVCLAFGLALLFPEARGRFFDLVGTLCSKISW